MISGAYAYIIVLVLYWDILHSENPVLTMKLESVCKVRLCQAHQDGGNSHPTPKGLINTTFSGLLLHATPDDGMSATSLPLLMFTKQGVI